jgi:hypothetical protein
MFRLGEAAGVNENPAIIQADYKDINDMNKWHVVYKARKFTGTIYAKTKESIIKDMRKIEKLIEEETGREDVIILNIIPMPLRHTGREEWHE